MLLQKSNLILKNHLISQTVELFDLFSKSARTILDKSINKITNEAIKKESYNIEGLLNIFANPNRFNSYVEELQKLNKNELTNLIKFYMYALDKINIDYNYIINIEHKNITEYINETENYTLKRVFQYTWQYGDIKSKEAIINYFDGNADIRFDLDPNEAYGKTTHENDKIIYHLSSDFKKASSKEDLLNASITLNHESYRHGDQRGDKYDTREAVLADINIAKSMIIDHGIKFLNERPHFRFLLYLKKNFKQEKLNRIIDFLYDSTQDYDRTIIFSGTELYRPKREVRDVESDENLGTNDFFSFKNAEENFKNFTDINPGILNEFKNIARIINFKGKSTLMIAPWSGSNYAKDEPAYNGKYGRVKTGITGRDSSSNIIYKKLAEYLKRNPLNDGEKLNLIGFSHGETVAVMVANKLINDGFGDKLGIFIGLSGINRAEQKYQMGNNNENSNGFELVFDVYDSYDDVRKKWAHKDTLGKKGLIKGNLWPEKYREHENPDFLTIVNKQYIDYPLTDFDEYYKFMKDSELYGPDGWIDNYYYKEHEITKITELWADDLKRLIDWYFETQKITKKEQTFVEVNNQISPDYAENKKRKIYEKRGFNSIKIYSVFKEKKKEIEYTIKTISKMFEQIENNDKILNQKKGLPESIKEIIQELINKIKPEIKELNLKSPALLEKIDKKYHNIIKIKNTKLIEEYKDIEKIIYLIENDIKITVNNNNLCYADIKEKIKIIYKDLINLLNIIQKIKFTFYNKHKEKFNLMIKEKAQELRTKTEIQYPGRVRRNLRMKIFREISEIEDSEYKDKEKALNKNINKIILECKNIIKEYKNYKEINNAVDNTIKNIYDYFKRNVKEEFIEIANSYNLKY